MIETRFVSYSELESYFISGDMDPIKNQLANSVLIGSISDVLYIVEQFQKNNIHVSLNDLNANFSALCADGSFYFPELDRATLLKNMFVDDELWKKPCNSKISPRFSSSLLTIVPDEYDVWSNEVFEQMEMYYLSFESYV